MKNDNSAPVFAKPVLPAVLKLTVKKEWFDFIKSGEKTEEYREIKPYWVERLTQISKKENYTSEEASKNLLKDKNSFPNNWSSDEYPIRDRKSTRLNSSH